MVIFRQLNGIKHKFPRVIIALGTFDGVHLGHQAIISRAVKAAREKKSTSVVLTFSRHPLSVIDPERAPKQIVGFHQKASLIASLGVDVLLAIRPSPEFLKTPPERFIDLLFAQIDPLSIVIGPNYSFGFKGRGTPEMLSIAAARHGCKVEIHPIVEVGGVICSSTMIRQFIAGGDMRNAARLLGRPPSLYGRVVPGLQRGRTLGFPTANLNPPCGILLPPNGVYAATVDVEGRRFIGAANIGINPTFKAFGEIYSRRVEVHLLNYTGDLYGKNIEVAFWDRLRPETAFSTVDALKKQISEDINQTLAFFRNST